MLNTFLHASGLHTLKAVISQPLEQLPGRISPRKSSSKTFPSSPRTFADIESWPEFLPEAASLENSLDDTVRSYRQTALSIVPGESISFSAADECEVRGCIMAFICGLNQAAKIIGIGVECVGGGSGRSTSFMDLILRLRGRTSDPNHLSCLILGAVEVKGSWQFQLERGEKLEDLLSKPERLASCLLALQQASCWQTLNACCMQFVREGGLRRAGLYLSSTSISHHGVCCHVPT